VTGTTPTVVSTAGWARGCLSERHSLAAELALVLGFYAAYEAARGVVVGGRDAGVHHALEVVSIERCLHVFIEGDVQRAAERVPGLTETLGFAYLTLHLALTGLVLLWVYQRRPAAYPVLRNTVLLASGLALVGYLAFPTAPPRFSHLGILDTISGYL